MKLKNSILYQKQNLISQQSLKQICEITKKKK